MLTTVIGEILPLTLALAISPLAIISVILMLLSPTPGRTGLGFLIGWTLGISIPLGLFVFLAGALPPRDAAGGPDPVRAVVQFVLAGLLLLLAYAQWRKRPKPDESPALPTWMSAIDSFTLPRALGLGLVLSGPRPKNLLIAASAGVTIGGAGMSLSAEMVAAAVFVGCAVSTVLIPIIAFFIASERLREPLEALRRWRVRENTVITVVLLVAIGVLMLGKALGSL